MDKNSKKIIISILLIVFGIFFISSHSDYIETLGIFLLVIGGGVFGNVIASI